MISTDLSFDPSSTKTISKLFNLFSEKAFLSPHSAVFTEECLSRMGIETVQNIIDFFDNKLEKSKIVKIS